MYGILVLQQAFTTEYVVQDDARQHVFWMRRFLDPDLFPNDWIADYFQAVAPWGYTAFYQAFAAIGIDPMFLAKILPFGLGLLTTAYGFAVSMQILPIPFTGFLSAVLVQQVLWTHDDVASATPRAFMPLLFLAFLYYLMRRRLVPCVVTIVLEGLFYPQYVFVFAGITLLQLVRWEQGRPKLTQDKKEYGFCAAILVAAFLVLLPFVLTTSGYEPTITLAEARNLQEFNDGGRSRFFYDDWLYFWFAGNRSGLFPAFRPATIAIGLLLPVLLCFPHRFPLTQHLTRQIRILPQIVVVALTLFFTAHAVLFKLHLPSRYSAYTLRFVLVFAMAISLTLLLDAGLQWLRRSTHSTSVQPIFVPRLVVWGLATLVGLTLLIYPSTIPDFPKTNYTIGKTPELYQFFAQQPKDSLIAGLLKETDDLPSFSQRSILVGREYAIPYHLGYANPFRQRVLDLIQAQYTLKRPQLVNFIRTYGVDFWLLSRQVFQEQFLEEGWIQQYPDAVSEAKLNLENGNPALQRSIKRCLAYEDKPNNLLVLDANCLIQ